MEIDWKHSILAGTGILLIAAAAIYGAFWATGAL